MKKREREYENMRFVDMKKKRERECEEERVEEKGGKREIERESLAHFLFSS